ncbi:nitrite reductase, copper-containing [Marinicauda algicola]|uniref:Copper-containing nitrite reductase n=1 Tax=Marinicauda algicola TaxID=2029849 RepID=A0A4S2H3G0_9PROT|nr:copper-containing nitrite reductase [Marinicauda algicola]TGY90155.1 nitrite reductase, copper-containing [Marinicauda algicola]
MKTRSIKTALFAGTATAMVAAAAMFAPAAMAQHGAHEGVDAEVVNIVADPNYVPPPVDWTEPRRHLVELETTEVVGQLADGTTYTYWTFDNQVPGPVLRVRVGDTVEVRLTNAEDSTMMHNIDFHAATGPGGGAKASLAAPGETKSFLFQALNPGVYVYHCATPMVASHIANGMYGLIIVEPEEGLPPVDREFYVMQGEIYTEEAFGTPGHNTESIEKLLDEDPEYYVFNGAAGALMNTPLEAEVGETVRIFFGVGGPNATSSFHVIGEIFDRVYTMGSLTSEPVEDVQTVTVAPGGAVAVDFELEVPGDFILVDHALSRAERGLAGILRVTGEENHEIFHALDGESDLAGH